MAAPTSRPSKPWRVYGPRGISKDHRSERAAYDHVQATLRRGVKATVYHWESGGWVLYERIDPIKEPWQVNSTDPDAKEA
jgi:hypothetical protein